MLWKKRESDLIVWLIIKIWYNIIYIIYIIWYDIFVFQKPIQTKKKYLKIMSKTFYRHSDIVYNLNE